MKRAVAAILAVACVVIPMLSVAQVYPPKPGVDIPKHIVEMMQNDRDAFRFQNAWIQKVERIRQNREAYIEERGFYYRPLLAPGQLLEMAVTGTIQVPVFCSKYSNTGADPYPASSLDQKLFTGPNPPQTLTQFYSEISYGDITVTGAVYGWHTLSQPDTYYEGGPGCNGLCGTGDIAQFITETLNAWDGSVNFGQYDNDGPDGIPNSGDDDGFVDFAAFVQPEAGAECGGAAANNIWSHRWVLSGWTGSAWTSNDAAAGGGFIRVDDYVMQPAFNCGGVTIIDIGVFCHEFGHAFGLPDLYDTDGGSAGIGHWGLMGSGSWNTVTQPAHMSAWSKSELGWVNLVEMGTNLTGYAVSNVEFNRPVLRANVMNERWRLRTACAIIGAKSMRCGLSSSEAAARGWPAGEGYGNGWSEKVSREFEYDGTPGPVWFDYSYLYDSEPAYDFTYAKIDVGGTVNTLATYNGTAASVATAHIDIAPYLTGGGPTTYTLFFEFTSDVGWSDEDDQNPTTCGPFVFDDVAVNGGGEAYFTGFEFKEDGWWCDMTDPSECFYIENRQALGSDAAIHGGGGLAIWHIDQDVANSAMSNTGGSSAAPGVVPRGVELMQSDGLRHLQFNSNRGDASDAYPGSMAKATFNNATTPNSLSYDGTATNVTILLTSGNGDPITIQGTGSWFPPTIAMFTPTNESNDKAVVMGIVGTGFVHGCTVELIDGATTLTASKVKWIGKTLIDAEVDLTGTPAGLYDVVVTNPGDGMAVVVDGFTVDHVETAVSITGFLARVIGTGVELTASFASDGERFRVDVYRSNGGAPALYKSIEYTAEQSFRYVDHHVDPGVTYHYYIAVEDRDGRYLSPTSTVSIPVLDTVLRQNYPNPFNPVTMIPFDISAPAHVTLTIYNIRGQAVRTLVDESMTARSYARPWDGRNDAGQSVSSGVYFYKLVAGDYQDVRKLVLMK